jgi:carbon storage regulator
MLVLSRQKDEVITIGDDIEICVVDIRGDKVRLGVSAPKAISVHRKEVRDAIRREARAELLAEQAKAAEEKSKV